MGGGREHHLHLEKKFFASETKYYGNYETFHPAFINSPLNGYPLNAELPFVYLWSPGFDVLDQIPLPLLWLANNPGYANQNFDYAYSDVKTIDYLNKEKTKAFLHSKVNRVNTSGEVYSSDYTSYYWEVVEGAWRMRMMVWPGLAEWMGGPDWFKVGAAALLKMMLASPYKGVPAPSMDLKDWYPDWVTSFGEAVKAANFMGGREHHLHLEKKFFASETKYYGNYETFHPAFINSPLNGYPLNAELPFVYLWSPGFDVLDQIPLPLLWLANNPGYANQNFDYAYSDVKTIDYINEDKTMAFLHSKVNRVNTSGDVYSSDYTSYYWEFTEGAWKMRMMVWPGKAEDMGGPDWFKVGAAALA